MSNIFSNLPPFKDFSGSVQMVYFGNAPSTITVNSAKYTQMPNKVVFFSFSIIIVTRVFTLGTDQLTINLPIVSADTFPVSLGMGTWRTTQDWPLYMNFAFSASVPALTSSRSVGGVTQGPIMNLTPAATNDGDTYQGFFTYRGV